MTILTTVFILLCYPTLLLSQKCTETDFSLLFLHFYPHPIHINAYLSTVSELCTLYLGQIQARFCVNTTPGGVLQTNYHLYDHA